jgi:hypothetical protein
MKISIQDGHLFLMLSLRVSTFGSLLYRVDNSHGQIEEKFQLMRN